MSESEPLPPSESFVRSQRIASALYWSGVVLAALFCLYGIWQGLAEGLWAVTGLFALLAYAAFMGGRAASCAVALRG